MTATWQHDIHIETESIPQYAADALAAATLKLIHAIMQQPGGREALDAKTAARHEKERS